MTVEFTKHPHNADLDFITQKINEETPEFGGAYPFAFFIRNENHHIIAGCNGAVVFGAIYTDQLWVHPQYRKSGLGHTLMKRVHDYGREQGCTLATVVTMSFQGAQQFYEKLEYVVDFTRKGYTKGSSLLHLSRAL